MADWFKSTNMTGRQMVDLPPVWLLGFIIVVWMQVWLWPAATWGHPLMTLIGIVLFWVGLALIGWTIWSFRTHETSVVPHQTPQRIITSGPFKYSRNPIYLGDVMVLAGVVLGHGALLMVGLVPLLAAILARRFIASEEARMKQSFGIEFKAYAERTRRWL